MVIDLASFRALKAQRAEQARSPEIGSALRQREKVLAALDALDPEQRLNVDRHFGLTTGIPDRNTCNLPGKSDGLDPDLLRTLMRKPRSRRAVPHSERQLRPHTRPELKLIK